MLEAYLTPAIILSAISVIAFVVITIAYLCDRPVSARAASQDARYALLSLFVGIPSAWLWPLTIPALIGYLMYRMYREAFPNGFKSLINQK